MILWLYCCSVLRRNIKKLDFLRNAINRLLFNDFFSCYSSWRNGFCWLLTKMRMDFQKQNIMIFYCNASVVTQGRSSVVSMQISPSFGNLSWIACPHLPPTSRWDVVHSLCHQKKVILTIKVNRTPFNWDEATIVSVASGNLT